MTWLKNFLKPNMWKDKEQMKRGVVTTFLLGGVVIFLTALFFGVYSTGSLLIGFIVAVTATTSFVMIWVADLPIFLIGIKKGWSKTGWMIISILMLLVGLLILLWRYTQF